MFFEDVVGLPAAERIVRGKDPGARVFENWPFERPLLVTERQFNALRRHVFPPPGYDCNDDGSLALMETERGDRAVVWFPS